MSQAAHQERLMTIIRGPHLSEKAHFAATNNQIVLKVRVGLKFLDGTVREVFQVRHLPHNVQVRMCFRRCHGISGCHEIISSERRDSKARRQSRTQSCLADARRASD